MHDSNTVGKIVRSSHWYARMIRVLRDSIMGDYPAPRKHRL